ncbi:MAG TPA: hypothetical protein PLZ57_07255 [Pseudobdellovibrionaceae bacterium]|nr:hypothetical protein [Pseudobdellovibrionaceae bacterium]
MMKSLIMSVFAMSMIPQFAAASPTSSAVGPVALQGEVVNDAQEVGKIVGGVLDSIAVGQWSCHDPGGRASTPSGRTLLASVRAQTGSFGAWQVLRALPGTQPLLRIGTTSVDGQSRARFIITTDAARQRVVDVLIEIEKLTYSQSPTLDRPQPTRDFVIRQSLLCIRM